MKGLAGYYSDRLQDEREEAEDLLATLSRQLTERIEGVKQRIRSFGATGEFALASASKDLHDLDFGEVTNSTIVEICLMGPVSMLSNSETFGPIIHKIEDMTGTTAAGLIDAACFLIDERQNFRNSFNSSFSNHKGGHYPLGRRQTKLDAVSDLFRQFNNVSNRNIHAYTQTQLQHEQRYLETLLKIVAKLEKDDVRNEHDPRTSDLDEMFTSPRRQHMRLV